MTAIYRLHFAGNRPVILIETATAQPTKPSKLVNNKQNVWTPK